MGELESSNAVYSPIHKFTNSHIIKISLFLTVLLFSAAAFAENVTLVATGDLMLGREIDLDHETNGTDPFEMVRGILKDSDLTLGNLECSLARDPKKMKPVMTGYVFRADTAYGKIIKDSKFDCVTLANNHALGGGNPIILETIKVLDGLGIVHFGGGANLAEARKFKVMSVKGVKFGFLGATMECPDTYPAKVDAPGVYKCDENSIIEDIKAAKKECDLLIVSIHWGTEKTIVLTKTQTMLAHKMLDEGADAIIGNHPHVLQGFELYKGKFIVYSLGNLVFDFLNKKVNTDKSAIIRLNYDTATKQLTKVEAFPIMLQHKKFYPMPATEEEKKVIAGIIKDASMVADKELKIMKILEIR